MLTPALSAADGTAKFLHPLHDGLAVESVLIPFTKRHSVCLSSQVGCAMACTFCHTGTMGLKRNLTAQEIIQQYIDVKGWHLHVSPERLPPTVVFMGQGEPMHNFDALKEAIAWLTDHRGGNIGPRMITVSTAGHVPGLMRFSELGGVNLALSLHSPFDDERSQLIPLNKKWPIAEVFAVLDTIPRRSRQYINCEYLLIKGLNHFERHAEELAKLLLHRPAMINIIPFNPFPGSPWQRPSEEEIDSFMRLLVARKLRVFRRTTKGEEIMAACGQLNTGVRS